MKAINAKPEDLNQNLKIHLRTRHRQTASDRKSNYFSYNTKALEYLLSNFITGSLKRSDQLTFSLSVQPRHENHCSFPRYVSKIFKSFISTTHKLEAEEQSPAVSPFPEPNLI